MADYIPSKESERIQWLWNLMLWLLGNGTVHGFTWEEVCGFYFTVLQAKLALDNQVEKQAGGGSPRLSVVGAWCGGA